MGGARRVGSAILPASFPSPPMPNPEYITTDFYLAAFLCHRGATLTSLRRLGPKKVQFRFQTGAQLHELLRLYWSDHLTPVVPWELFTCYHLLKCLSIDRYDDPTGTDARPIPQLPPTGRAEPRPVPPAVADPSEAPIPPAPMIRLTPHDVAEFRVLYRRQTGRDIPDDEAREYAERLIRLVALAAGQHLPPPRG